MKNKGKDHDRGCSQCRLSAYLVFPVYTDSICIAGPALTNNPDGLKMLPLVMLVRHSTEPRAEELRHLHEIANMIWPGMTWRQGKISSGHFQLHAEE